MQSARPFAALHSHAYRSLLNGCIHAIGSSDSFFPFAHVCFGGNHRYAERTRFGDPDNFVLWSGKSERGFGRTNGRVPLTCGNVLLPRNAINDRTWTVPKDIKSALFQITEFDQLSFVSSQPFFTALFVRCLSYGSAQQSQQLSTETFQAPGFIKGRPIIPSVIVHSTNFNSRTHKCGRANHDNANRYGDEGFAHRGSVLERGREEKAWINKSPEEKSLFERPSLVWVGVCW